MAKRPRRTIDRLPVGAAFDILIRDEIAIVIGQNLEETVILRVNSRLRQSVDRIPIAQAREYWTYSWAVKP